MDWYAIIIDQSLQEWLRSGWSPVNYIKIKFKRMLFLKDLMLGMKLRNEKKKWFLPTKSDSLIFDNTTTTSCNFSWEEIVCKAVALEINKTFKSWFLVITFNTHA